ncbi:MULTISPECIES: 50S ribosomal protein L19e [Natrinema]|uniref:Large ribosomal subunit protein eL19 n=4 Tax=Natrinema TaxID=88723 RepID=L9ZNI2_NATA2|nr:MULTISPECIES: 50S ribosomal protein L19e [Natrinema]AFO57295.1 Ribosomal protein L19e [Natrinema sp. J7-2]ELY76713.1 50S ribosomal protein L19e [Natrinema pallidum DSM 3751]ELY81365.1 50S ribosomal protein L19e [Natrinema gari JCM 14663]ELY86723.1 50S ribosomal protein L19e [Natrinema altunense JCM 12890]QCW02856.1 50S ribosomal protein L19e [Natrinema pallidum]
MTDLTAQKRLAADVLDVGENRVWLDPDAQGDIAEAITRDEIRELVDEGRIQADDPSGNSRGRARERNAKRAYGHQNGQGKRRGKKGARQNEKDEWQNKIRAQRRKLRELRDKGELTPTQYRELYKKAGGGEFRSVRYLLNYIDETYGDQ